MESYRLPENEGIVFSWRFDPRSDGTMFSRKTRYRQFQEKAWQLANISNEHYVVVTDITDFFPNLYHHRVENALRSAAPNNLSHTKAIVQLLSAWREKQSFGLPVGPNASRLIAEVAIHDIDLTLRAEGLTFVRYADDFRIFCKTRKDAYKALVTLAEVLWKNHGLTLVGQKTDIMPVEVFKQRYFRSGKKIELERLSKSFADILDILGLDNWYEDIEYDDLDSDLKDRVHSLNIEGLLTEQLRSESIDIPLTRFILRRLSQFQDADAAERILTYIDKLYPVFVDVIAYFNNLKNLTKGRRLEIGKSVLELMDSSVVSHLEYHRLHLLNLFATTASWGNAHKITELWSQFSDYFTRRKLILALGQSGQNYWFRLHKTDWQQFSPWERRAFLRGASSLEGDERRHWYDSISGRLNPLEGAIVRWSRQNPIYV